MTAGRGFIGLAAMIVGRWTPLGAFGAALLFASSVGIGQSITHRAADRAARRHPDVAARRSSSTRCPYLVTIIVLAGVVGRSIPPAADGQPYEREAAT